MPFTVRTPVANASGGGGTGSQATGALTINIGDTGLLFGVANTTTNAAGTVTDNGTSGGNVYTSVLHVFSAGTSRVIEIFACLNATKAATVLTYTPAGSGTSVQVLGYGITSSATPTVASQAGIVSVAQASGTDAITTGVLSATATDALILSALFDYSNQAHISAGTGLTLDGSFVFNQLFGEHLAISASRAATWSCTTTDTCSFAGIILQIAPSGPQYITKWTPFRWACAMRSLQQGANNVGNRQQNRLALLASAITNANGAATWAKWRVGENSRVSSCGLMLNVPLVPGFVPPVGTVDDGT